MKPLHRRTFLRGATGIAIGLPLLDAMEASAALGVGPALPRFVFMFSPNGTVPSSWTPTGTENSFTLNGVLAPLRPFQSKLNILDNVDMESANHGVGDGHQKGMGSLLTGAELQPGTLFQGGGDSGTAGWADGVSVDQYIAQRLTSGEPYRSLELGVCVGGSNIWSRMCYSAPGQPIPPENSPANVFNRLFRNGNYSLPQAPQPSSPADAGGGSSTPTTPADAGPAAPDPLAILRAQRRSVLDTVGDSFRRLSPKVSSEDRKKLDAHLNAVRSRGWR